MVFTTNYIRFTEYQIVKSIFKHIQIFNYDNFGYYKYPRKRGNNKILKKNTEKHRRKKKEENTKRNTKEENTKEKY